MDQYEDYNNINFEQQPNGTRTRLIVSILLVAIFTFLWLIVPFNALYWVLLIPLLFLIWAANYGFREALSDLIKGLQRIAHL